jgi:hypothetical protein
LANTQRVCCSALQTERIPRIDCELVIALVSSTTNSTIAEKSNLSLRETSGNSLHLRPPVACCSPPRFEGYKSSELSDGEIANGLMQALLPTWGHQRDLRGIPCDSTRIGLWVHRVYFVKRHIEPLSGSNGRHVAQLVTAEAGVICARGGPQTVE